MTIWVMNKASMRQHWIFFSSFRASHKLHFLGSGSAHQKCHVFLLDYPRDQTTKNNDYKVIFVRTPIKYISDDDEIKAALEARANTLLEMHFWDQLQSSKIFDFFCTKQEVSKNTSFCFTEKWCDPWGWWNCRPLVFSYCFVQGNS